MKNSLSKITKEFTVVELDDEAIYTIKKNTQKITIYDEKLTQEIIEKKFNEKYKRLLYIIMEINNSDDATESDCELVRNQIHELEMLLLNKFKKYLPKSVIIKYLKMLVILKDKIPMLELGRGR